MVKKKRLKGCSNTFFYVKAYSAPCFVKITSSAIQKEHGNTMRHSFSQNHKVSRDYLEAKSMLVVVKVATDNFTSFLLTILAALGNSKQEVFC